MKKGLLFIGFGILGLSSCIEHEVIPAPTPKVELEAHFIGIIGGAEIEFTENVLGYYNTSFADLYVFQSESKAVYRSQMMSDQMANFISVGHGPIYYDGTNVGEPTLAQFNNFFSDPGNQTPAFSNTGLSGMFVRYSDGNGRIWASDSTGTTTNIEYVNYKQGSDDTGDYHMFELHFNCMLYSEDPLNPGTIDSMTCQNAVYNGWYKR